MITIQAATILALCLNVAIISGRVTLGTMTTFTVVTQISLQASLLPPVSYVKSLDIWNTSCLIFVFAAFIEFSIASVANKRRENILNKRKSKMEKALVKGFENHAMIGLAQDISDEDKEKTNSTEDGISTLSFRGQSAQNMTTRQQTESVMPEFLDLYDNHHCTISGDSIDNISKILFPVSFIIFASVYWFLHDSQVREWR